MGIWKPQKQKSYNITTICFSLCHQENMHNRYLLDWTFSIVARLCITIENEQTPGDGEGPGSPACCNPWDHKESDMIEQLKNKE